MKAILMEDAEGIGTRGQVVEIALAATQDERVGNGVEGAAEEAPEPGAHVGRKGAEDGSGGADMTEGDLTFVSGAVDEAASTISLVRSALTVAEEGLQGVRCRDLYGYRDIVTLAVQTMDALADKLDEAAAMLAR